MDAKLLFVNWAAVYWLLDGIGLIIWWFITPVNNLWQIGIAQILCVAARIFLVKTDGTMDNIVVFTLLLAIILLVLWRKIAWKKQDKILWEKRWCQLGQPLVWNGIMLISAALIAGIFTMISIVLNIHKGTVEHTIFAYILGATAACIIPPGSFGLGACLITKWLIRIATICASIIALKMLIN